jgi:hypothetical protein
MGLNILNMQINESKKYDYLCRYVKLKLNSIHMYVYKFRCEQVSVNVAQSKTDL